MTIPLFLVNAFTRDAFGGNPAAVRLLSAGADARWMQLIAAQMNLSETAFVSPEGDGFRLRWFTPRVEVDLCGHATLASAHVLWESDWPAERSIPFFTRSGTLTITRQGERISMDFPARPAEPCPIAPELQEALRAPVRWAGRNGMDWLIEVEDEVTLRGLQPDLALLATLPVRGTIVTARGATGDFDFVSRFFAPAVGVPEDPVTGSAHCCLGPFWAQRLNKTQMRAYQASARGGEMTVRVDGERVHLGGEAITVLRGELPPMSVRIYPAEAPADVERVRGLLTEYIATLPGGHDCTLDHDVTVLPGAYAAPRGRLLLAEVDGEVSGCVALRPQGPDVCEMKRMYVRPAFRGRGVGRALIAAILDEARQAGYARMRLDTLPSMSAALALYQAFGFRPGAPYLERHPEGALCFELAL